MFKKLILILLNANNTKVDKAEQLKLQLSLISAMSETIHALQQERGTSRGYIVSNGTKFQKEFHTSTLKSDTKIFILSQMLKQKNIDLILNTQGKKKIIEKWSLKEKAQDYTYLWQIASILLIVIIIFIYINYKLKALIHQKTEDIEKQKEELEHLLSSLDENVIFSKTDLEGKILHVSKAFCEISGYSKEELIGEAHSIVRHPDMPSSTFKDIWKALKQQTSIVAEIKNRKKSGDFYWVESKFEPDYDKNNNHIGYTALRVDITSKKAVEELSDNLEEKILLQTHNLKKQLEIVKVSKKKQNELLEELETVHKHIKESIEYASLIQGALIPNNKLFRDYFQDYFAIWHPKDTVGGDIYLFEE
ncbi:MAG: PAS domain S-box protein, partial [Campylobacterota bacterium]|nr:PAS domain S-box protein [Campylobacterota bacterium]